MEELQQATKNDIEFRYKEGLLNLDDYMKMIRETAEEKERQARYYRAILNYCESIKK